VFRVKVRVKGFRLYMDVGNDWFLVVDNLAFYMDAQVQSF
jgi:hypothetical protein